MADVEALIRDLEMAYSYRIETLGSPKDVDCDAQEELEKARDAIRAALTRPAPSPSDVERSWRCFHCDEVFTDAKAAREHFGSTELDEPGCKMLAKGELELLRDYRDMAARWQRCVSEDCEASRIYHRMSAKIATAERDAEQRGYDKGLADGEARMRGAAVPDDEATIERVARALLPYVKPWAENRENWTVENLEVHGLMHLARVAIAAAPEAPR